MFWSKVKSVFSVNSGGNSDQDTHHAIDHATEKVCGIFIVQDVLYSILIVILSLIRIKFELNFIATNQ